MEQRFTLFSSGTEFGLWQERNCERCVKAVFYNEKTNSYPKYRCAIQRDIEAACIGDGKGNKRVYVACRSDRCPHIQTERSQKRYVKKDKRQMTLDL